MEQDEKPLTIERTLTLLLPSELVEKLILEAIGAPEGATVTSDVGDDYGTGGYRLAGGMRITWTESERHRKHGVRPFVSQETIDEVKRLEDRRRIATMIGQNPDAIMPAMFDTIDRLIDLEFREGHAALEREIQRLMGR